MSMTEFDILLSSSSASTDIETSTTASSADIPLSEPCPHCGKYYRGHHGVKIHIARAHPQEYRASIVERQSHWQKRIPKSKQPKMDTSIQETLVSVPPCPPKEKVQNISDEKLIKYHENMTQWKGNFENIDSEEDFYSKVEQFSAFLANAITLLPGPQHPASRYYNARKKKRLLNNQRKYQQSSNPERASKRDKEKRKSKYKYQLVQFQYYNQRRKAVRSILRDNNSIQCQVNIKKVQHHFTKQFSVPNDCIRSSYSNGDSLTPEINTSDDSINKEEICQAAKKIAVDTAPGPDHVLMRAIHNSTCYEIIALIATRMLFLGQVPPCLTKARTILIHKGGDVLDLDNWRPITICSVIRRIIERVLDRRLRELVSFNEFQRGFTNTPGSLINTSILNSILREAKSKKSNVTLIFLDIRKAFDHIGHHHLKKTLSTLNIPPNLANLISKLQELNTTQIEVNHKKTDPIKISRGVLQGSPLSPALYNIATDHILQEISHQDFTEDYGFTLIPGLPNITVMGFADDTVIVGKDAAAAGHLADVVIQRLTEIGLEINYNKSKSINIENGKLNNLPVHLTCNKEIPTLGCNDTIQYLGVTFNDETIFDSRKTMETLRSHLDLLTSSPLLQPHQKFNVVSSFICPKLVYPFQTTSPDKIPARFLTDADLIIKNSIKEIIQLPGDIPDNMLYTAKQYKGLGIFRARWEAYLQSINSCVKLQHVGNLYIRNTRNLEEEITHCVEKLHIPFIVNLSSADGSLNVRKLRKELRLQEYKSWCTLQQKGKGVALYSEFTPANKWITRPQGLSSGEWKEAIKMTANVCAVRAIPGRSQDNHCRRCLSEIETLGHVLGFCQYGETLRLHRHHTIRSMLAKALRDINYVVYEEVHGTANDGSNRRIDIIAFKKNELKAVILDPTIRFETHRGQPDEVHEEKKTIYMPTIPYYKEKYHLEEITVTGLMFGARGTIPHFTSNFCKGLGLTNNLLMDMALVILRHSTKILKNHLFGV